MAPMLAVLLAALLQQETLDALLRRLSDDDPSRRDEAAKAVSDRWKEWKEAELARLRKAGEDPDQELAGRAREALATIELRRRLGDPLLGRIPGLEEAIRNGPDARRRGVLALAAGEWREKRLDDGALRTLAALALERRWTLGPEERLALADPKIVPYAPFLGPLLAHENVDVRIAAADRLGGLGAREFAPAVAALLKETDKTPRVIAMRSLAEMGARDQAPAVAVLLDPTEAYEIRMTAIESLTRLHATEPYAARILPNLADGAGPVVTAAVLALGHAGTRAHAPRVAELLKSDGPTTRAAAVDVLGRMGAHEQAGAVAALLKDETCGGPAIEALGRMGAAGQVEAILPYLTHEDDVLRGHAARALGRMGATDRAPRLLPLLGDISTDVRWKAVQSLGDLLTPETSGEVAKLLASDQKLVRGLAANILGRAGATDRADGIVPLLEEGQPFLRCEAVKALAALHAGRHLREIVPLLQDEFKEVRIDSALSLGRLAGTPMDDAERRSLFRHLDESAESFTGPVRLAAQVALACHGKGGAAYARLVLRGMREGGQDFADVLFDGLAALHEKAGSEKLSRPILLDRAVDSIERLREVLASAGLRLEGEETLSGRVPPGVRTTPRRLLQGLWELRIIVPEGDRVRLLSLEDAYDVWEQRLAGK